MLALKYFASLDVAEPIYLYINSDGGNVDAALSIIDEMLMIQRLKGTIVTIAQGSACSAAADILALGSPGHRFATQYTTIMLHPVSLELPEATIQKNKKQMHFLSEQNKAIAKLVAAACGKDYVEFESDIADDMWLTARQALDYGVIDDIYGYSVVRK